LPVFPTFPSFLADFYRFSAEIGLPPPVFRTPVDAFPRSEFAIFAGKILKKYFSRKLAMFTAIILEFTGYY